MSIYFEYPAINDYPNPTYAVKIAEVNINKIKDEYSTKREEIKQLQDFLALKPI